MNTLQKYRPARISLEICVEKFSQSPLDMSNPWPVLICAMELSTSTNQASVAFLHRCPSGIASEGV